MTPLLSVRDLRREFAVRNAEGRTDTFVAVDGVDFELAAGESLAVVGESGSGKTTTARIVAGLDAPTSGRILVNGSPLRPAAGGHARRERARHVQMVFQDPYSSLDPRQRAGRAVDEILRCDGSRKSVDRRRRTLELFESVGLDDSHLGALPRRLSGGQRQRLAIAKALATRPRLLILDEAVAALDVSVQAQILNLLADLREQTGVAYLFISHDLGVVRQVSERCVVMHRGRVVESGDTQDVLDNPQHDYTRRLLDAVPRPGWIPQRRFASQEGMPLRKGSST
jgi:oligopeptide transport system ATP-binding protein